MKPSNQIAKAALLAEALRQPETLDRIGIAWRLFFRLVLVEAGSMVATYEEAGIAMGANAKTVRNWADALAKNSVIKKEQKGRRIKLSLLEPYMSIAQAPDSVVEKNETEEPPDPQTQALIDVGRIAKARQSKIEIKLVV